MTRNRQPDSSAQRLLWEEVIGMRSAETYRFDLSQGRTGPPAPDAATIFEAVWRFDFAAPGFCVLDLGAETDSRALRSFMLELRERLSEVGSRRVPRRFAIRSLGRFDQQATTRLHLDGAPDQSLLVLGYEPSKIRSRLLLADYTRCAHDLGIDPRRFLDEFNPMYRKGEELLSSYVTELPEPVEGRSRIVLINNSSLPFDEARTASLGVMHGAEILNPTESERRIVNSMMLAVGEPDEASETALKEFVETEEVSKKFYG